MIEIRGADEFVKLSKALKAAESDLQKELAKAASASARKITKAVRSSVRSDLPSRGGFAEGVARSRFTTQKLTRGRVTGVRVRMTNAYALRRVDQGSIRHPVHGTDVWVVQKVPAGTITRPFEDQIDEVRREFEEAMRVVARKFEGRV